jgi:hypothetical protein
VSIPYLHCLGDVQLLTSIVGALRFPYAETLPFPYPLTTTLFQLIWTHACLLLGGSLACSINKSLDDLEAREDDHFISPSSFKNALSALNWSAILRILPLAVTVAAEAALGNYVLYNMPFEVYLLSRVLVLPFLLLLDRFIYAKVSADRLMYPSIALAISGFITAFKPRLPHSGWTFLVVISSSILSALWPLQVQIRTRSAEPLSKGEYIVVGSAETVSKKGNMETYTIWQLLYYTSLLSAIILIPVVLYSGEPGHILRNCYFLNEFRFWLYMAAGGMFRLTFFTATILLIEKTSALTVTFFCVLVNVTQITFFTFEKLRRLQLVGLTAFLLSSLWLLIASIDFNLTWGSIWENNRPTFRWRFYSVVLLITIMTAFGTILQIWHEGIVDTSPPLDRDDTGDFPASLFTSMVQGADSYLGHRPPTNSVMNLQLLMEECEGTNNPITRDVFRCLEFLSTKRDLYLITPSEPSQHLSGDGESAVTDPVDHSANMCDGPIIPYHIWWSGLPTWRVELFIKAYLHTQNLPCSRLWIWVDGRAGENSVGMWFVDQRFRRFMPLVETGDIVVKQWMLPSRIPLPPRDSIDELDKARYYRNPRRTDSKGVKLVADSVLQDAAGQEWLQFYDDENQIIYYEKALSNVARFSIIHMHGGIYLDPGTILLRDIRPLLLSNISFIEKPDPREPFGNAIIALPANSSISSYILRGGTRMGLFFHAAVLQRMFVKEGRDGNNYNGGLVRLEDAIFDPIWAESHGTREGRCTVPCLNSYVSVFKAAPVQNEWESFDGERLGGAAYNRTLENFYKGAFAYHIHGQVRRSFIATYVWD